MKTPHFLFNALLFLSLPLRTGPRRQVFLQPVEKITCRAGSGTGRAEVVEEGVPSNFFTSCEQLHYPNYDLVSKI